MCEKVENEFVKFVYFNMKKPEDADNITEEGDERFDEYRTELDSADTDELRIDILLRI